MSTDEVGPRKLSAAEDAKIQQGIDWRHLSKLQNSLGLFVERIGDSKYRIMRFHAGGVILFCTCQDQANAISWLEGFAAAKEMCGNDTNIERR